MTAGAEGGAAERPAPPQLRSVAPPRDPVWIGPYRVVHRIGEGGMGLVHLALDGDGRAVAVKVLRAQVAGDPQARQRMAREVATLRRVRHPQVAEVLDADVEGELPYLVTRFVPGQVLEEQVAQHGPLPADQVAHLGRLLAGALTAIHAAGVVHRDVKPGNVMLLDGDPVLIDFGIAHLVDETRLTMTGLVMGTPGYLAPEVVAGQALTPASDWWGWGATLAFAATGRAPFGTGPLEVVLDRVRRAQADLDGLDPGLRPAVTSALVTDPARRGRPPGLVAGLNGARSTSVVQLPATLVVDREAVTERTSPPIPMPPVSGPPVSGPPVPPAPVAAPPVAPAPPTLLASASAPDPDSAAARVPRPSAVEVLGADGFRTTVLLGALAALAAIAAVSVAGALVLAVLLMTIARTVERCVMRLGVRRVAYGPRRSDVTVMVLATPWRVVVSFAVTVVAGVLPLLVGSSVVFLGLLAVGQAGQPAPQSPPVQAIGAVALLLCAWWGPGGGSLRRGTQLCVRGLGRSRIISWVLVGGLGLTVLAALMVAVRR